MDKDIPIDSKIQWWWGAHKHYHFSIFFFIPLRGRCTLVQYICPWINIFFFSIRKSYSRSEGWIKKWDLTIYFDKIINEEEAQLIKELYFWMKWCRMSFKICSILINYNSAVFKLCSMKKSTWPEAFERSRNFFIIIFIYLVLINYLRT